VIRPVASPWAMMAVPPGLYVLAATEFEFVLLQCMTGGIAKGLARLILVCIEFMFGYSKEVNFESVLVSKAHAQFVIGVVGADMMDIFREEAGAVGWFWD
jgi:hypothetical protein